MFCSTAATWSRGIYSETLRPFSRCWRLWYGRPSGPVRMTDSLPGSMRVTAAICLMRGGMGLCFMVKVYVKTYTTQQKNKEFLRIPRWKKKSVMHPDPGRPKYLGKMLDGGRG